VEVWRSGDQKTILKPLKRWGGLNAVALVMKALSAAPDEAPAPTTKTLPFIPDAADRAVLQNDIAGVERAIQNGEWKAATVLAGSVIEALLLWALSQDTNRRWQQRMRQRARVIWADGTWWTLSRLQAN
jgi:hypothetical protein